MITFNLFKIDEVKLGDIDLDIGDLSDPIKNIFEKTMEKIGNATGWIFPKHSLKQKYSKIVTTLLDRIEKSDDLSDIEKLFIVSNYNFFGKRWKNIFEIVVNSFEFVNKDAKPEEINDDWINDFVEKAAKVSNCEDKIKWSKIFSMEINNPNSIPKRLLHNLFLMDSSDFKDFLSLTRFCYNDKIRILEDIKLEIAKNDDFIVHPIIFAKKFPNAYEPYGINSETLVRLQSFNLIECNFVSQYCFNYKKRLSYKNHVICIINDKDDKKINAGNVKMTKEGLVLYQALEEKVTKHLGITEFNEDVWANNFNYSVIIES